VKRFWHTQAGPPRPLAWPVVQTFVSTGSPANQAPSRVRTTTTAMGGTDALLC
jgi:hypothetical protein